MQLANSTLHCSPISIVNNNNNNYCSFFFSFFFKDSNILSCLCGWLLSVMDPPRHTQFLNQHSHIVTKWNLDHLRELLEIFLNNNWISNLATGFAIFQMVCFLFFFYSLFDSQDQLVLKSE